MTLLKPESIQAVLPEMRALRHELHQHPEIRFEEQWTSDRISRFLSEVGIPHTRGHVKGTGIVGTIQGGAGAGETVLLRADMDGLELNEETGLPYASRIPNRMHACGHDGHMACLCGAAKVLYEMRHDFAGCVRCIFQPAEEQASGGYYVAEEGLLDGVCAAYALHGWPGIPAGKIMLREGFTMASADFFSITVRGKGGHGADPGSTVDPILVAAHIITALQSLVSRETDPWNATVVSIGRMQAGMASNIIPDTAQLEGSCRALNADTRKSLRQGLERIASNIAEAFRATAEVSFGAAGSGHGYPPLYNHPEECAFVRETLESLLGPSALLDMPHPSMASEDFAYYLEKVPGAFLFLGVSPEESTDAPALHTCGFDFNDEALETGVTVLTALALKRLEASSTKGATLE